ncbi:ABC transporter ATP-binding protein [Bovifimicola ammoniilytica]|jgi:ABC-type antimicrobial peptide transport system, ATPase component|uniref:ABC transporter ATP-binding protein n=1 Tax=Bovifimicola ammoniilytica TaxID=2981720 RepID=UPI000337D936|nr:ABC transporter ATP-binding protein [Bovifimicola ammoniilytica]MCU6754151.1 ABC transporter ATP-binding protein [Bovifimicola ammoniilytica]CCZ03656.1 aBC-type antimicrobial peptide transport system ATPase component [Eubacterium sp. CAG:603]SCJ81045.1 Lipoprotein-releasing system ATP-binding protein LolD [uncultured Eubacterium sp.]
MIRLVNINKTYNYKKANAFCALKGINLSINDGEMLAIIGKSGAGKSTLMHILGCIDDFESGDYLIDDINVKDISNGKKAEIRNKKIGIVMQDFALIEEYTVIENVMVPLLFDKSKKDKKKTAIKAIESVGIGDLTNKPVNKLSGGQKQRVAIARAIVNDPVFILADEPTGALDSNTSLEIMQVFKDLNKLGKTIIIITHDKDVAQKCDRIVEMKDGSFIN